MTHVLAVSRVKNYEDMAESLARWRGATAALPAAEAFAVGRVINGKRA